MPNVQGLSFAEVRSTDDFYFDACLPTDEALVVFSLSPVQGLLLWTAADFYSFPCLSTAKAMSFGEVGTAADFFFTPCLPTAQAMPLDEVHDVFCLPPVAQNHVVSCSLAEGWPPAGLSFPQSLLDDLHSGLHFGMPELSTLVPAGAHGS